MLDTRLQKRSCGHEVFITLPVELWEDLLLIRDMERCICKECADFEQILNKAEWISLGKEIDNE